MLFIDLYNYNILFSFVIIFNKKAISKYKKNNKKII